MKKRIAIILAALLIAASATSCGKGKKNDETTQSNKIDINTEAPEGTGNATDNTTESGSANTETAEKPNTNNEVKNPGEYSYTAVETAEKVQVLSSSGAAMLRTEDYTAIASVPNGVPNGTQLDRIGISNDATGYWSKVVYEGEVCYIASHLVTTILDLDDGFVDVSKTLTKNDGSLKIRMAPDMNSEVVGYLYAGNEVIVVAENTTTGWYKISFVPYGATEAAFGYVASDPKYYKGEDTTATGTEITTEASAETEAAE